MTHVKKIPDSIVPPEALGRLTSCMEQVRNVAHAYRRRLGMGDDELARAS